MENKIKEIEQEGLKNVEELKEEIENIQESNQSVIKLYEYHNEWFRERVRKEIEYLQSLTQNFDIKNDADNYASLLSDLSQRDAVCKNLKEENKELKSEVNELKYKLKESKTKQLKEFTKKPSSIKYSKVDSIKQKSLKISNKSNKGHQISNKEENSEIETAEYNVQDCQEMLKRISLFESENIKLSSKL